MTTANLLCSLTPLWHPVVAWVRLPDQWQCLATGLTWPWNERRPMPWCSSSGHQRPRRAFPAESSVFLRPFLRRVAKPLCCQLSPTTDLSAGPSHRHASSLMFHIGFATVCTLPWPPSQSDFGQWLHLACRSSPASCRHHRTPFPGATTGVLGFLGGSSAIK